MLINDKQKQNSNSAYKHKLAAEDTALFALLSEPLVASILRMTASLLQPACLGGSPVTLPVHLQEAVGADTHVSQTLATSVITPCPGARSIPMILDQSVVQYISSQPLAQSSCLIPEQQCLQNLPGHDVILQSTSVPSRQPWHTDRKSNLSSPAPDSPPSHTSELAAAFQEHYSNLRNCVSSACKGTKSPLNPVSETFFHPESALPYLHPASQLVSLVPPATLLVPYPLLVPLPVPLPIPIPIPIPVSNMKKTKSTQTATDVSISMSTHSPNTGCCFLQLPMLHPSSVPQEEVLDLSVKATPIQSKQLQCSVLQDSALDLSVSCKPCTDSCSDSKSKFGRNSTSVNSKSAKDNFLKNKMIQLRRAIPHSINSHPINNHHVKTSQLG
uniref:Uncharacterized protein n=1 Tax=Electrophorus electricus TaxID=8005 RepID=A0AAY5E9E6_ELEEL